MLRTWGHEFPHEARALIKVYGEALRVVNEINPNPQQLNAPIRCRPDQKWLSTNPFHPPAAQPIQAVPHGSLPKAILAVQPLALIPAPPNQAVPEGVEVPTQPFENNVMMFPEE